MDKVWLKSYPADVPHDIHPEQYSSLSALLEESFKKHAASPFTVCMNCWMTYQQLDQLSAAFGAWLQSKGFAPGARIAIMLPNIPQFPVAMCGILRAGFTCVNVNPLYTPRELAHQLKDSGATAIVILENFASTLAEVIETTDIKQVVIASMGDLLGFWYGRWLTFAVRHLAKMVPSYSLPLSGERVVTPFSRAISDAAQLSLKPNTSSLDSIAFLQYTGGTTGLSKGAVLSHRNIVSAVLQAGVSAFLCVRRLRVYPRRCALVGNARPFKAARALSTVARAWVGKPGFIVRSAPWQSAPRTGWQTGSSPPSSAAQPAPSRP